MGPGHNVQYALYRRNADETTTRELLYEVHPIVCFLVEQNPPAIANPDAAPGR